MAFGRPKKPKAFLDEPALYDYALASLGRRMRTVSELQRLLRAKVEPGEHGQAIIDRTLARLREYRFLDDQAFADNYTQLRQQNEKHGARRVRQDLAIKGVPADVITQAVEARYAEVSEETLAREHLERKRIRKPENEKETARIMRRLVTAGFSPTVIYKILRQWSIPDETLAALDNLENHEGDPAEHTPSEYDPD
jgi:regulatory protein